jgi:hypothetical protein
MDRTSFFCVTLPPTPATASGRPGGARSASSLFPLPEA